MFLTCGLFFNVVGPASGHISKDILKKIFVWKVSLERFDWDVVTQAGHNNASIFYINELNFLYIIYKFYRIKLTYLICRFPYLLPCLCISVIALIVLVTTFWLPVSSLDICFIKNIELPSF
jgi:hypothetical protein